MRLFCRRICLETSQLTTRSSTTGLLRSSDGEQVGLDVGAWSLAKLAATKLIDDLGNLPLEEDIEEALREHITFLDDMVLPALLDGGQSRYGGTYSEELRSAWSKYDWVQKHQVFLEVVGSSAAEAPDANHASFMQEGVALALLHRLDDAALAVFAEDTVGLCQCIGDAYSLSMLLDWPKTVRPSLPQAIESVSAAAVLGKRGADARHFANREAKKAALRMYAEGNWLSRADAYRRIAPLVARDTSTVKKWFEAFDRLQER